MKYYGEVKNGRFEFYDKPSFDHKVQKLEGRKFVMELKQFRKKSSDQQRKYYWSGLMGELESSTGNSKEWWHDKFKQMFLTATIEFPGGQTETVVLSSEDLDTKQREQYHEAIRRWAWEEQAIKLYLPNEKEFWQSLGVNIDEQ